MARTHIFHDVARLNDQLATDIHEYLRQLMDQKQEYVTWALSGGNSPGSLLKTLIDKYQGSPIWSALHVYWVDERFVPHDDSESNYGNAKSLLLDLGVPESNLYPMEYTSSPQASVEVYEALISELAQIRHPDQNLFDVTLLGIGPDGHLASLFPGSDHQHDLTYCKTTVRPETGQARITLTLKALESSSYSIFLAYGASKAEIIARVLGSAGNVAYPASLFKPLAEPHWYLDQLAATKLEQI